MFPQQMAEVATVTVLTATFFGVYLVFLVGPMLGVVLDQRAAKARLLYLIVVLMVAFGSFKIDWLRSFFDFTSLNLAMLCPVLLISLPIAIVQLYLAHRAGRKFTSVKK